VNQTTKTSPIEFYRQVRQEVSKVTWPSRKETTVTTSMVFLMVLVLAIFFLVIDQMASFLVRTILSFGG
jgi:preprotein translocase subunit SecE